jgi:uncharacterized protein (DUF1499 family)
MKTVLVILVCLIVAVIILLFVLGAMSRSGKPPGMRDGALLPCPDTPNCVSSEIASDTDHYIEPIVISDKEASANMEMLKAVIGDMGGTIQTEQADYLAATFSSPLFGFVDDLEIRFNPTAGLIHMRSASRVGRGDMGVNRKRIETLKAMFMSRAKGLDDQSG